MGLVFIFEAKLWLYPGEGAWYFVTLPQNISQEIKSISGLPRRGFGSFRVQVKTGKTTWKTSIFPDNKSNSYLLPIKKEIRTKNNLEPGSIVSFSLTLPDLY